MTQQMASSESNDQICHHSSTMRRGKITLPTALAISLAIHAIIFVIFSHRIMFPTALNDSEGKAPPQKIIARQISNEQWAKNRTVTEPSAQSKSPTSPSLEALNRVKRAIVAKAKSTAEKSVPLREKPKPKKEPPPKGKVVAVSQGNGQVPEDSRFLAETNNKVAKQTRSRHGKTGSKRRAPRPVEMTPTNLSSQNFRVLGEAAGKRSENGTAEKVGNGGKGQALLPKSTGTEPLHRPSKPLHKPLPNPSQQVVIPPKIFQGLSSVPLRFHQAAKNEEKTNNYNMLGSSSSLYRTARQASPGMAGSAGGNVDTGRNGGLALAPSAAFLGKFAAGPASDLTPQDGILEGEGTYLNTREWKHAGFFNRIKENVSAHWNPNAQIALKDPTGQAYLYKDRYTTVSVTLDGTGTVKKVEVTRSSGVDFLDEEAMDAFRRAEAFPHPPTALQNARGEITFTFGFYIETHRGRIQIFR